MGNCFTRTDEPFDKLAYPSYCSLDPATESDRSLCFKVWHAAVRIRLGDDPFLAGATKSFNAVQRIFLDAMAQQHICNVPDNFFVQLVSAVVYGRHDRIPEFRQLKFTPAAWSAAGTALIISVRHAYAPQMWTDPVHEAWIRAIGDVMRRIFRV